MEHSIFVTWEEGEQTFVLRYTPSEEGHYLLEGSTNGGATYPSSATVTCEEAWLVIERASTTPRQVTIGKKESV